MVAAWYITNGAAGVIVVVLFGECHYPGRNLADVVVVRLLDRPEPGRIDALRRNGLLLHPSFHVLVGVVPIPHNTFGTGNAHVDLVPIRLGWVKTVVYKMQGESYTSSLCGSPRTRASPTDVMLVAISLACAPRSAS